MKARRMNGTPLTTIPLSYTVRIDTEELIAYARTFGPSDLRPAVERLLRQAIVAETSRRNPARHGGTWGFSGNSARHTMHAESLFWLRLAGSELF
jgi:hypothetical protein